MKHGFILETGNKVYLLETEKKNKCKAVVDAFINGICDYKHHSDELRECFLKSEPNRKDVAYKLKPAEWDKTETKNTHVPYWDIKGENFGMWYPEENWDELIFLTSGN